MRMRSNDSCTTVQTVVDSAVVTFEQPGGGNQLIDLDNPGHPIFAGPNPISGRLSIYGLMSSKTYSISLLNGKGQEMVQRHVEGQQQATMNIDGHQTGLYFLRVYDVTKGRVIGFVKLLAVAGK